MRRRSLLAAALVAVCRRALLQATRRTLHSLLETRNVPCSPAHAATGSLPPAGLRAFARPPSNTPVAAKGARTRAAAGPHPSAAAGALAAPSLVKPLEHPARHRTPAPPVAPQLRTAVGCPALLRETLYD
nr:unnamed protein product [Digitaria exilis]